MGYLILFPWEPTSSVSRFVPETTTAIVGQSQTMVIDFCVYDDYTSDTTRSLVNDAGDRITYLSDIKTATKAGCHNNYKFKILIPADFPLGKAHVETTSVHFLTPLHTETIERKSESFEVVAAKP